MVSRQQTLDEIADHFVDHETAFHLGFLPTEQSHPVTKDLSAVIQRDPSAGIGLLQRVDRDIPPMARRVLAGEPFGQLAGLIAAALRGGGRVWLSGCGATGRLCLLLESAWRRFWQENRTAAGPSASRQDPLSAAVCAFMTGGDFAFMRSVESFEDYASFGAEQTRRGGVHKGDLFIGISEGGETSSVIGSVREAMDRGARAAFVCNNPHGLLRERIERSGSLLKDPRVLGLDLTTGPMALAGSTRMQATSAEMLVVGAAMESALAGLLGGGPDGTETADTLLDSFERLLDCLEQPGNVRALADWAVLEADAYAAGGAVTYFADSALADIYTDTTERTPTFALPPFRRRDDLASPRPLTVAVNPLCDTAAAWRRMLGRPPRCLDWPSETYRRLGAPERIANNPPAIDETSLLQFTAGNEPDPSRHRHAGDTAILLLGDADERAGRSELATAFLEASGGFPRRIAIRIASAPAGRHPNDLPSLNLQTPQDSSRLRLGTHLARKLAFNTVSTAAMTRLGRARSNWMTHVQPTNKKLIDRGARILADLAGLSYREACRTLLREMGGTAAAANRPSPVHAILHRLTK